MSASVVANCPWITGPKFLLDHPEETTADVFSLLEPDKDPETPTILTPATLLTQKLGSVPAPPGNFKAGNLCYDQWKRVQHLANCFWNRWKMEYLSTLQGRRKWQCLNPNLQVGDLVLLKDQQAKIIEWPMGLIVKSIPSDNGKEL